MVFSPMMCFVLPLCFVRANITITAATNRMRTTKTTMASVGTLFSHFWHEPVVLLKYDASHTEQYGWFGS